MIFASLPCLLPHGLPSSVNNSPLPEIKERGKNLSRTDDILGMHIFGRADLLTRETIYSTHPSPALPVGEYVFVWLTVYKWISSLKKKTKNFRTPRGPFTLSKRLWIRLASVSLSPCLLLIGTMVYFFYVVFYCLKSRLKPFASRKA